MAGTCAGTEILDVPPAFVGQTLGNVSSPMTKSALGFELGWNLVSRVEFLMSSLTWEMDSRIREGAPTPALSFSTSLSLHHISFPQWISERGWNNGKNVTSDLS